MNLLLPLPTGPSVPNFKAHKQLEGIATEALGWERATAARDQILYAMEPYRQKHEETEA